MSEHDTAMQWLMFKLQKVEGTFMYKLLHVRILNIQTGLADNYLYYMGLSLV